MRSWGKRVDGELNNNAIDMMKLILSIFVVLIHSEVNLGMFTPFLRIAVPLFFIISSFFLQKDQ